MARRKTSRLRRWLKRAAVALAVLLIAAVVTPFLFTTTLVRWALAHSAYKYFNPVISKASLGPTGYLTLRDVELFEAGPFLDAPLISAKQVQISFSWWKVLGMTISSAQVEGLIVHVRPGRTYPVTLLTLSYPPGMDGVPAEPPAGKTATPGTSGNAANPFWFDRLHVTGTLKVQAFENFQLSGRDLPLTLDMAMHGARNDPFRDVNLALGEPATARTVAATQTATSTAPTRRPLAEVGPALTASLRMIPVGGGRTQIVIDHGEGWNLAASLEPELLRRFLPVLGTTNEKADIVLDRVSASGSIDPAATGSGLDFHGQVEAHDVSVTAEHPGTFGLDQFSVAAKLDVPLGGGALTDLGIHDATTGLGTLDLNGFHAGRTQSEWSLEKGVLNVQRLQAGAFDGSVTGNAKIDLLNFSHSEGKLVLEHIEEKQILALLPERWQSRGGITAEGHVSGEIDLRQVGEGLEGTVGLTPVNDLAIKMNSLTLSPGAWNPSAQQAHQMEARVTAVPHGKQWEVALPRVAVSALMLQGNAEALRKQWAALPANMKGPVEATIGAIEIDGKVEGPAEQQRGTGHVSISEVALHTPQSTDYPVNVEHLTASGAVSLPLSKNAAASIEMDSGSMALATAQLGKFQATAIEINWTLLQDTWRTSGAKLTAFGGQTTGGAVYHLNNGVLEMANLNIQHLDQHLLLAAINPEKVDGEGLISGPVEMWNTLDEKTGRGGPLQFKGKLVADGPGRLMIKDQDVAQQLSQGLNQVNVEMLPPNFGDIVKGQLKNYPYLEGRATLESVGNQPVLHLDYHRAPLTEGEPGYGVKAEIGGQAVTANYPIQLSGVTVRFGNKSVSELLEMVTGWEQSILNLKLPPAK